MIRIYHPNKPQKLIENECLWTVNLLNLVRVHGGYDKIPKMDRDAALAHYKDSSFIETIFRLTNSKCTFCESIIDTVSSIHVEHFYPKSLYPKMAFKWTNLIPSCGTCNSKKGNFDTKSNPFVNPMFDEPDEYFDFTDCRIKVSNAAPDSVKAENTIKNCDLKRTSLTRAYATIIGGLYDAVDAIEGGVMHYHKLTQASAKQKKLFNILEGIKNLLNQSKSGEQYAGFVRAILRKNPIVTDALVLLNKNRASLGLVDELTI